MSTPAYAFQKRSLAARVAEILRDSISRGELKNPLPGEHQLAENLGISRPTLRHALAVLAREGIIETAKGRRTRIIQKTGDVKNSARRVCVISCSEQRAINPVHNTLLQQIHLRLAEEGILWEEFAIPKLSAAGLEKLLKELTAGRQNTCWLLVMSSAPVQSFFADSGQSALILGSNFPDVSLPAVDWDYEAIGRHAAHTLLRSGHRRIALFLPRNMGAGDWATRKGFKTAIKDAGQDIIYTETASDYTRPEIEKACDRLLRKPSRPGAVFVFRAVFAFALLTRALSRGVVLPGNMSLLCRDDHPLFETVFPAIDRYAISETRFIHSTLRLLHTLLEGQHLDKRPHFITPERIQGETLADASGNS